MKNWDRRRVLTGLGSVGASLWLPPSADALGLADDKIKRVRYFSNSGDAQGRRGQPMVNQSTNVVMIETEGGLVGIGEGGEPTSMDECASMLIGQDPFRIDQHWQRMLRGYFYPAGREKLHSLGALDVALWDLKAKALDVQPGSSVAVFGAGAVGLAAVMAAAVAGAATIIAVDLQQHRLDLAVELGATHVVAGDAPDVTEQIVGITGGGVQNAFDTTGLPGVMLSALRATRMTGRVGLVGVQQGPLSLDTTDYLGRTILNILEGSADPHEFIPYMLELWQAGRFPFDRLIEQFPLEQINEAEQSSLAGGVIKPVLRP